MRKLLFLLLLICYLAPESNAQLYVQGGFGVFLTPYKKPHESDDQVFIYRPGLSAGTSIGLTMLGKKSRVTLNYELFKYSYNYRFLESYNNREIYGRYSYGYGGRQISLVGYLHWNLYKKLPELKLITGAGPALVFFEGDNRQQGFADYPEFSYEIHNSAMFTGKISVGLSYEKNRWMFGLLFNGNIGISPMETDIYSYNAMGRIREKKLTTYGTYISSVLTVSYRILTFSFK